MAFLLESRPLSHGHDVGLAAINVSFRSGSCDAMKHQSLLSALVVSLAMWFSVLTLPALAQQVQSRAAYGPPQQLARGGNQVVPGAAPSRGQCRAHADGAQVDSAGSQSPTVSRQFAELLGTEEQSDQTLPLHIQALGIRRGVWSRGHVQDVQRRRHQVLGARQGPVSCRHADGVSGSEESGRPAHVRSRRGAHWQLRSLDLRWHMRVRV